jgi:hypothetical protein
MGAIKALALLTLIAVIMVHRADAQPSGQVLQYYWVGPEEVWLWQLTPGLPPLKATFNPSNQQWTTEPADSETQWRAIFELVALGYNKDAQVKTIPYPTLQAFALAKLRNEYPKVNWARSYPPFAQIYILPNADPQKGPQVKILGNNTSKSTGFFKASGKWAKGNDIALQPLFQVDEKPEELGRIFGSEVGTGTVKEQWIYAWDSWIDKMLLGPAREQFSYTDSSNQQQWVLKEVLSANDSLPDKAKVMPATLTKIQVPDIAPQKIINQPSWNFSLRNVLIALIAVELLAIIVPFAVPSFRKRLYAWFQNSSEDHSSGAASKLAVTPTTLNDLHFRAVERSKKRYEHDAVICDFVVSALEAARRAYDEVSEDVLKQEQDQRTRILDEYRTQLGVSGKSDDDVQRLIGLGQKAEELSKSARRKHFPKEIVSQIEKQPEQSSSDEQWLAFYPNVIAAYESAWQAAVKDKNGLNSQLSQQTKNHEAAISTLTANHAAESGKMTRELQKKTKEQADKIAELESQLKQTQEDLGREQTTVKTLNGQITNVENEHRSAQEIMNELNKKINQIQQLREISVNLRTWLQGYHNKLLQENTREVRTVSILTSLISFSVSQMCFGVAGEKDILTKASANNVLKLIHGFEQSGSSSSLLNSIETKITTLVPDVKTDFGNDSLGGSTYDDHLFREFLNFVKMDTKRDLSPFYIDLDKNEHQTLVHVST